MDMLKICCGHGMGATAEGWISSLWEQRAAAQGCHTQYSQPKIQSHPSKRLSLHLLLISAWDEDVWGGMSFAKSNNFTATEVSTMLNATWIRVLTLAVEYLHEQVQLES